VVKSAMGKHANLDIEGRMLSYLREHSVLPVPEVVHSEKTLLIMSYIDSASSLNNVAQEDAAHYLSALHNITAEQYGLSFDTLIGGLHQPNRRMDSWIDFFREQRLLYMAKQAYDAGKLPLGVRRRVEQFATQLDDFLFEPDEASLIHGDMWGGNVLAKDGKIAGFIDPAIYYAHAEIELAFSTLFSTFGDAFFAVYNNLRPIEPDFFEVRRDIYNLYPLLVHVRLFGGGYVSQVSSIVSRLGF
ncbi:MAG: fructosamine kinase family protein, partial [Chloroflexota bacterium]